MYMPIHLLKMNRAMYFDYSSSIKYFLSETGIPSEGGIL